MVLALLLSFAACPSGAPEPSVKVPGDTAGTDSGEPGDSAGDSGETGQTDCPDGSAPIEWFPDLDGDGFGGAGGGLSACEAPPGYVADATDCDDTRATVNPAATEVCDALHTDEDCDGVADDADASVTGTSAWYADLDGDSYGDEAGALTACAAPEGYVAIAGDCDDGDAAYNPGAVEVCDEAIDYNCDGSTGMVDADADTVAACMDCDDGDAAVFPGAAERCNAVDDDCDGTIDEPDAADASTWYIDADADGWGSSATIEVACAAPSGFDDDALDCDDADAGVRPDAPEVWYDGTDQDCDGRDDDQDGDGYLLADDCDDTDAAAYPGAAETALDGIDQDCDGFDDGADTDGDGLLDTDETTTDPYDADSDDDGLEDGDELALGTDPGDEDTDDDGLLDGNEVAAGTDPFVTDSDADGWSDGAEVDGYTDPLDDADHPYTGGWAMGACRSSIVSTGAAVGDIAPDFALTDQYGETVHLHDFCDRAILLDFTEFW